MKTAILIFIASCTAFSTQAQSKKKVHEQLLIELQMVQATADSMRTAFWDRQREIKPLVNRVNSLSKDVSLEKNRENIYLYQIKQVHSKLLEMQFDIHSLVPQAEIQQCLSREIIEYADRPIYKDNYKELSAIPVMKDLTNLGTKEQNEILRLTISEYRIVNEKNKTLLQEEQLQLEQLEKMKISNTDELNKYAGSNEKLVAILTLFENKAIELEELASEKERIRLEKEYEVAQKRYAKNPKTLKFVPPMVVDREEEPSQDLMTDDVKTNAGSDFIYGGELSDPAPEPKIIYESPKYTPVIFDFVDEVAEYPGGKEAMLKFLADNMKMPPVAEQLGVNGKVYLKFVISETGNISNVKVMRGVADCPECDDEAVRVVKAMPNWIPAKNDGKVVNCWYSLPIAFKSN